MKKLVICLSSALFAFAAADIAAYPTAPQNNPWFYTVNDGTPDDQSVPVGIAPHTGFDQAAVAPASGVQYNGPDKLDPGTINRWGNDVLVMALGNPTFGHLSTDQDQLTGDMYVSLLVPHTGVDDTVYTYRSTDGGDTWALFTLQNGAASTGGIRDHEIIVGHDGSNAWIYSFCLYDDASTMGGLWVVRMRPDNTGVQWTQIVVSGDTLANFNVDRNIESPQHLFACWETNTNDGIRMQSSSDYSLTWGNARYVASVAHNPTVCAGGDGYVYIAYQNSDTVSIRIGRYTNNLISPTFVFNSVDIDPEGDFTPSVAASRTTPGTSQVAWVLYKHNHQPNKDIHIGWTLDGGTSWTSAPWPVTNTSHSTWDMKYPYGRVSYNSALLRTVATVPEVGDDSLVYAFTRNTSPTTWEDRGVWNDYSITGEFGGEVEYSSDCLGGYLVYREYASPNVWCDAYNFTGIEENKIDAVRNFINLAPNPARDFARLTYTTRQDGNVSISMYDATGRLVNNLINEAQSAGEYTIDISSRNLAAGIYFVKVETPDGADSKTVMIVR